MIQDAAGTYNSSNVAAATTVTANLTAADFTPGAGTLVSNYVLPISGTTSQMTVTVAGTQTYYDGANGTLAVPILLPQGTTQVQFPR